MARSRKFPKFPSRPHASGQARITIKGKAYYLGPFGSPEAAAEYARLAAEFAAGQTVSPRAPAPPTSAMTVSALIVAWHAHEAKERGKDHQEVIRIARAVVPMDRLFGKTKAAEFTAKKLEAVQVAMRDATWMTTDEMKTLPRWSRNYLNKQVERCIRVFRWAEKEELVPLGIVHHLRTLEPIKKGDKKARHLPPRKACDWETQVKPCLPHVSPQVAAMIQIQWLGGMRPGEVVVMTRGAIDRVTIPGVWLYRPVQHKGLHLDQELVKPLGPLAQAVLAPWLLAAADDDVPIFRPSRGATKCYNVASYGVAVLRACEITGVAKWSPYSLRYDAERRAEEVAGISGASAHLGHRHLETTKSYAELQNLKLAAEVARKIG